jgi:hypothetical protein
VIRDPNGAMMAANAFWYNQLEDASMAEVLTVRDGLELTRNMSITKIEVESGCSSVVHMLKNTTSLRSSLATVFFDVEELMKCFNSFSLNFIKREANCKTHCCAKFVDPVHSRCTWVGNVPDFLREALIRDCYIVNAI